MIVDIETRRLRTIGQLQAFVEGSEAVDFHPKDRAQAYGFVRDMLEDEDIGHTHRAAYEALRLWLTWIGHRFRVVCRAFERQRASKPDGSGIGHGRSDPGRIRGARPRITCDPGQGRARPSVWIESRRSPRPARGLPGVGTADVRPTAPRDPWDRTHAAVAAGPRSSRAILPRERIPRRLVPLWPRP